MITPTAFCYHFNFPQLKLTQIIEGPGMLMHNLQDANKILCGKYFFYLPEKIHKKTQKSVGIIGLTREIASGAISIALLPVRQAMSSPERLILMKPRYGLFIGSQKRRRNQITK